MRLLLYDLVTNFSSLTFQPTQPVETNFEGSGDSDSDYADENEDDSFDYYGSGDEEEDTIEDSYSPQQPNTDLQNPRNNYQDPYAGQGWNPDPRDPYDPTYRNSNNQNNNFNSQYSPTQQVNKFCLHSFMFEVTLASNVFCKKSDKILGQTLCPPAQLRPGQPG